MVPTSTCYGSLAAIIAKQFFSGLDEGSAFIFALLAFAAGFIVRPFGALVFRPPGRHDWSQVHLPGHHLDHGPVHFQWWVFCLPTPALAWPRQ